MSAGHLKVRFFYLQLRRVTTNRPSDWNESRCWVRCDPLMLRLDLTPTQVVRIAAWKKKRLDLRSISCCFPILHRFIVMTITSSIRALAPEWIQSLWSKELQSYQQTHDRFRFGWIFISFVNAWFLFLRSLALSSQHYNIIRLSTFRCALRDLEAINEFLH